MQTNQSAATARVSSALVSETNGVEGNSHPNRRLGVNISSTDGAYTRNLELGIGIVPLRPRLSKYGAEASDAGLFVYAEGEGLQHRMAKRLALRKRRPIRSTSISPSSIVDQAGKT